MNESQWAALHPLTTLQVGSQHGLAMLFQTLTAMLMDASVLLSMDVPESMDD